MKRAFFMIVLVFAGCRDTLVLDDIAVAYACEQDAGACSRGWRCGYDNKCFDPSLSSAVGAPCRGDDQCSDDARCGEANACLTRGVGSAAACVTNAGCEGGWRCGAQGVCFDSEELDGGASRSCTGDEQCPSAFRCGQSVDGARLCQQLDVGAASPCVDDDGCLGGWRCDTIATRCVLVTDVVQRGVLHTFDAEIVSPVRSGEGAPLRFAMSRESPVELSRFGFGNNGVLPASSMARLVDGGVWYVLNLASSQRRDGGDPTAIAEEWLPWAGDTSSVREFAVEHGAVYLLLNDGGVDVLSPGGAPRRFIAPASALTQGARMFDYAGLFSSQEVFVSATNGSWGAEPRLIWDGGHVDTQDPSNPAWSHSVVVGASAFVFTNLGLTEYSLEFGTSTFISAPSPLPRIRSVHAGLVDGSGNAQSRLAFLLETEGANGVMNLVSWTPWSTTASTTPSAPLTACPFADAPQQVSFVANGARAGALVRCREAVGTRTFTVEAQLSGFSTSFVGSTEAPEPFASPPTFAESASIGRAMAGPEGRAWHVPLRAGTSAENGDMRGRALRPLVLDRMPETMVTLIDGLRLRTFARAGEWIFGNEPALGLVSSTQQDGLVPLGSVGTLNWLVTTTGVTQLRTTGSNARSIAIMPPGATLQPPISSALHYATINGTRHDVLLIASGDSVWAADVSEAAQSTFSQPALLSVVLVPTAGVKLRGVAVETSSSAAGVRGFVATSTQTWRFESLDLERWGLQSLPQPSGAALPAELWTERGDGKGRVGFSDGTVWSLPVMVALSKPIEASDGGTGRVIEYARQCGDLFATTNDGVFALTGDAGLPGWSRLDAVSSQLDVLEGARLYETQFGLFVASKTGRVARISYTPPLVDGGCE